MTDYDINDDDLPTFSPRDVMRRLERLELDALHHQHNLFPGDTKTSKAFTLAAPTPPPTATPDEAAKWEQVARASHAANRDVQGGMHWDDYTITVIHKAWIAGVQAAVAKAIALGLAAPADRVVCEVTDALVDECLDAIAIGSESGIRTVLNIAAAYWSAGDDTQEES